MNINAEKAIKIFNYKWRRRNGDIVLHSRDTEASECEIDVDDPAVTLGNGYVTSTNPDHYSAAFSLVWGKVFGHNDTDTDLAHELLETYLANQSWDWSKLIHPNLEIIEFILSRLKSTAPGLDGITNAVIIR